MREIEHLSRLYVAWLFVCAEETKVKSAEDLRGMQEAIAQLQATMADNKRKIQELTDEIQELQKKRDKVGGQRDVDGDGNQTLFRCFIKPTLCVWGGLPVGGGWSA